MQFKSPISTSLIQEMIPLFPSIHLLFGYTGVMTKLEIKYWRATACSLMSYIPLITTFAPWKQCSELYEMTMYNICIYHIQMFIVDSLPGLPLK